MEMICNYYLSVKTDVVLLYVHSPLYLFIVTPAHLQAGCGRFSAELVETVFLIKELNFSCYHVIADCFEIAFELTNPLFFFAHGLFTCLQKLERF